jgi:hemolysin III
VDDSGARVISTAGIGERPTVRQKRRPEFAQAGPSEIPRMRGWLHAYAFAVAVPCSLVLCALASMRPGTAAVVSCALYSVTLCGLLGVSALYHGRRWSTRGYQAMRHLDHSMIFLFIAGTYAPFCVLLLPPETAKVLLGSICGGALAGVALKLVWLHAPRWLSVLLYVLLGWGAVAVLPGFFRGGGLVVLVLLLGGGAVYSLGAMLYALRRPDPWPGVFGHHEFFHACTLVAATCHHIAIYFALYP